MKIISFNTYLAPTMPHRFERKRKINKAIHNWLCLGIDVIGLQELNCFTIGILGYIFLYLRLYKYLHFQIIRLIEVMMILEGCIFPVSVYDNTKELFNMVKQHNLECSDTSTYYIVKSEVPTRGVSAGLVLITKSKQEYIINKNLQTDFIHKPGLICARCDNNIISNAHYVPHLPQFTYIYKLINYINKKLKNDIDEIRNTNTQYNYLAIASLVNDSNDNVIMLGDFNICREKEPHLYMNLINTTCLIDSAREMICTQHCLYNSQYEFQQIDYILSNKSPKKKCRRIETLNHLSDHYPILTEYE